jgi:hypothetical protein
MILWTLRGWWIKSGMSPHLVLTWIMIELIVLDLPAAFFTSIWLRNLL